MQRKRQRNLMATCRCKRRRSLTGKSIW
jgi:hypothetical protein